MPDQSETSQNTNVPQIVNPGSQIPSASVGSQSPSQPVNQASVPVAPLSSQHPNLPKRRFPKKILLAIPFLLLLIIFVFLLSQLKSGGLTNFGKKGEIVWWGFWNESVVAPLISDYEQQNSNVKITYVTQSEKDYRERLTNNLARGSGPDIFHFHNTWVPMFTSDLEPAPTDVLSVQEFSSSYYPVIRGDLLKGSNILGLPLGFDALTLYINEDMLAAAGASVPVTWDEFRTLARQLTTRDDNDRIIQSGAAIGRTENIDHWQEILALMMLQNGVNPNKPTGQLAADAVKFYTVFATEDKVWDETLPPSTIAFANGKVAMYFGPSWRAIEIGKANSNLRYKTVPLPQLRKDDPAEPDVSYATYWVEGVWNKSSNKQEAWKFLEFLSQKQQQQKLYENLSMQRIIGEPYPRVDMGNLLTENKIIGSIAALAPQARSWYLADDTNDGPTGINSQLELLFKQVVDNVISGHDAVRELSNVSPDVAKTLSQYGIQTQ